MAAITNPFLAELDCIKNIDKKKKTTSFSL